MPRGRTPRLPTLKSVVPSDGFDWQTLYGNKPILSNNLSRQITKALNSLLPTFTEPDISHAIIKMFQTTTDNVDGPITTTAEEFWGVLRGQVTWLRNLDEHTILLFSWAVCSARNVAHEHYALELDLQDKAVEDYPMPTTEATRVVTDFGLKLRATQSFEVTEKLLPSWIYDSQNQGDKESTQAAFEKSVQNVKHGLTMGGKPRDNHAAEHEQVDEDGDEVV
ncbi:hypothetical protein DL764_010821 [Monosporascus ibericus]|uniref:Uncharacterized protein n=1 Tax=Monosporascus ibericus TaxID=155417 RepID=A0A4Q4SS22_9PEZI|nr:hypothetical protein DL764_010821 [Monosporascus ibericus]